MTIGEHGRLCPHDPPNDKYHTKKENVDFILLAMRSAVGDASAPRICDANLVLRAVCTQQRISNTLI